MRTKFDLSDDQMFQAEAETLKVATEVGNGIVQRPVESIPYVQKRYFTRSVVGIGGIVISLVAMIAGIIAGFVATTMGYGNKLTAGLVTLAIIFTSIVGIGTANHIDTPELALVGGELPAEPQARTGLLIATIDSGATSSAVPLKLQSLLHTITDHSPNQQIKIADGKYLEVVKIGKASFTVAGHSMETVAHEVVAPQPCPDLLGRGLRG